MLDDPIVAEVRAIRERLAAECDFDIRRIFESARKRQALSGARVVSFEQQREASQVGEPTAAKPK